MQSMERRGPDSSGAPPATGTAESDVALYFAFVEIVTRRGVPAIAARYLSADFVDHGLDVNRNARELLDELAARHRRFPDGEWIIDLLVGVGGLVLCHATMTWTSAADRVERCGETVIARVAAGQIAECWRVGDGPPGRLGDAACTVR